MTIYNRQFRLAARPVGMIKYDDFSLTSESLREVGDGEFLVRIKYISLDPAMRGWMNERKSIMPPVGIGEVMRAGAVGEIVASRSPRFSVGAHVAGLFGVQEYAFSSGREVTKVDPSFVSLPTYLGALGVPGLTAYFGLLDVGALKSSETVVISGAAGAVGSVAGQIAKIKGCKVIGIAGGAEKCRWLVEDLHFDAAIDRKSADVAAQLTHLCPHGINVFFDNVGGEILDAGLAMLAMHARVVICGAISQYNKVGEIRGPANYLYLAGNRARMEGIVAFDYMSRYPEAIREISKWIAAGKLKPREDIVEGFDTFPVSLVRLFEGANIGKLVLRVN